VSLHTASQPTQMTTTPTISVIDLAPRWRPAAPMGDDRTEANTVLNQVLSRSLAITDELRAIANRHFDEAPASCAHVAELAAILSRSVLTWIEEWPH
jgi:hypothetical protein